MYVWELSFFVFIWSTLVFWLQKKNLFCILLLKFQVRLRELLKHLHMKRRTSLKEEIWMAETTLAHLRSIYASEWRGPEARARWNGITILMKDNRDHLLRRSQPILIRSKREYHETTSLTELSHFLLSTAAPKNHDQSQNFSSDFHQSTLPSLATWEWKAIWSTNPTALGQAVDSPQPTKSHDLSLWNQTRKSQVDIDRKSRAMYSIDQMHVHIRVQGCWEWPTRVTDG